MEDDDDLDAYASKVNDMAVRYAQLRSTLDEAAMVKKLLDTVPGRLYVMVAGIEQSCKVEMAFEEAVGRLKAFEERTRRRLQVGGKRAGGQLMMTAAQWAARVDSRVGAASATTTTEQQPRLQAAEGSGERRQFRRECLKPWKAQAAEQDLLADANVEYDGLLWVVA
ncbi:hypothetical protein VPH35_089670 [Triticum aestivum]